MSMISFENNFFFIKFLVLFFLITVFGYWGIDLNSEEIYIAFSFFLLVAAAILSFRSSLLNIFVTLLNKKYNKLLVWQCFYVALLEMLEPLMILRHNTVFSIFKVINWVVLLEHNFDAFNFLIKALLSKNKQNTGIISIVGSLIFFNEIVNFKKISSIKSNITPLFKLIN